MWSQVEAALEDLRPVIEAYGLTPSVVDVLDGEVTLDLTPTAAGLAFPENLPDLLERTLVNEVPGVRKVVVRRPAPPTDIRIEVDPPRPEATACRFRVEATLAPDGTSLYFDDPRDASSWPLVVGLLEVVGVRGVILRAHEVMVSRLDDAQWSGLIPGVEAAIRAHLSGAARPKVVGPVRTPEQDAELWARVERILEEEVNPAVAAHGGVIRLDKLEGSTAWLHMGGGCQGCGMAAVTLRQGVERLLLAAVPEITQIRDATDHTAGDRPYYAS